jgi:hypothetical protein
MNKSYWYYVPIIVVLFSGFIIGGFLSFGVQYLNALAFVENEYARWIISSYGVGLLGSTTYCSKFWSRDIEEVVYRDKNLLPHFFDFIGYLTLIVGGGITGVILLLLIKTGISVSTTAGSAAISLTGEASVIFAYIGGLCHFRVQRHLGNIIDRMLKESKVADEKDIGGNLDTDRDNILDNR